MFLLSQNLESLIAWVTKAISNKLQTFNDNCLRQINSIRWPEKSQKNTFWNKQTRILLCYKFHEEKWDWLVTSWENQKRTLQDRRYTGIHAGEEKGRAPTQHLAMILQRWAEGKRTQYMGNHYKNRTEPSPLACCCQGPTERQEFSQIKRSIR